MDCKTKSIIDTLIHYNDSLVSRLKIICDKDILKGNDIARNTYYRLMFIGGFF